MNASALGSRSASVMRWSSRIVPASDIGTFRRGTVALLPARYRRVQAEHALEDGGAIRIWPCARYGT
jgi:hypothetical protein